MKILSPSYKRANDVLTHLWLPGVAYCVHSFEVEEYRAALPGVKILEIPDDLRGSIARARNWCLDQAKGKDLLIIDDDVKGLYFWDSHDTKIKLEGERALEFIDHGFLLAKEWGVKLWGVNCAADKGGYREYTPFGNKSYCSGSFHGILGGIDLRYDEKLPLKEDYDFCLQVLNRDRRLLRFNMVHMVKDDHANVGGCADYRTVEIEKEQMKMFQEKWGKGIVQLDSGASRVNRVKKGGYDINPIVKPPIAGI